MRFLMVTTFFPPHNFGGDGVYVRQLATALAARGHAVTVVHSYDAYRISGGQAPRDACDPERDPRLDVRRLDSPAGRLAPLLAHQTGSPAPAYPGLVEILREQFDVVHFHNISLMGGPGILKLSRAPVSLATAHDHWLVCAAHIFWKNAAKPCDGRTCLSCQIRARKPPQLWRLGAGLTRAMEHVDLVLAPSRFTKRMLHEGGIARPIAVQPLFAPVAFNELSSAPRAGAPTFLYVGRVTASKGIDRFARLMRQRPNYRLQIVGDGDLVNALRAEFADAPNVALLGRLRHDSLPQLYRQATAAVIPSLAPETFGLSTIEAFSQGTPAIVRDAGGAGEEVEATGSGFVYRSDVEALSAMDALAGDAALRSEFGHRARAAFLERYTESRHVEAYLGRIDDVMAGSQVAYR